jgi:hypothetical protein
MTTIWTPIPKPLGTTYTNVNFSGKYTYDDSTVLYDDANVFYDGVNQAAWSTVAKPTGTFTTTPGMATGLIMSPTYLQKTTETAWTLVPKPT